MKRCLSDCISVEQQPVKSSEVVNYATIVIKAKTCFAINPELQLKSGTGTNCASLMIQRVVKILNLEKCATIIKQLFAQAPSSATRN